jgi:quaternary ammonium compound-resistance protein SugE
MSTTFAWVILSIAGLLEVCWAIGLKYTDGFTKIGPSIFTLICLAASMFLLAKASQVLPIGTAYAIWVGIGALGASVVGILVLKEPASAARIIFLLMLLVSIIGLKLSAK